jgi:hypothetical protein
MATLPVDFPLAVVLEFPYIPSCTYFFFRVEEQAEQAASKAQAISKSTQISYF